MLGLQTAAKRDKHWAPELLPSGIKPEFVA